VPRWRDRVADAALRRAEGNCPHASPAGQDRCRGGSSTARRPRRLTFVIVYNGEQEFRPLPSGGLLPAEHGRNKSNSKAASRPIGDTPKGSRLDVGQTLPPSCHVEGLPSGPVQMVRSWSNVKSAREKVWSSRARGKFSTAADSN